MRLNFKLNIVFVVIGIVASQIIFWQGYISTEKTLEKETFNKLTAIREGKKRQIESYFKLVQNQAVTLAENHTVPLAAEEFHEFFHQVSINEDNIGLYRKDLGHFYSKKFHDASGLNKNETAALYPVEPRRIAMQYQYIAANPYPVGSKDKLDQAEDDNAYNHTHSKYHPVFRNYVNRYGYDDLFLVDLDGNIVYSVSKEVDFATNLIEGPFKKTNIGEAFRRANSESLEQPTILVDFKPYLPSSNAPAAFIATPLYWDKERVGVLILQLPINEINFVMTGNGEWQQDGLGMSGETYLLGDDQTMRSDSRFLHENPDALKAELIQYGVNESVISKILRYGTSVLSLKVKTSASLDALAGNTDTKIIKDYRNIPVLSSYAPLEIQGLNWVILSEIDLEEAFAPLNGLKDGAVKTMLVISLAVVLHGIFFSRKITTPLRQLLSGINKLENGDLKYQLMIKTNDEFGNLADSFNLMSKSLRHTMVSRDYMDDILSSMSESLFVIKCKDSQNCEAIIETTNPAAVKMLEEPASTLKGQEFSNYFPNNDIFSPAEWQVLYAESQHPPVDKTIIRKSGKKVPILLSAALLGEKVPNSHTKSIIFVAQDITMRKEYEEKIKHLASHDPLTNLPNRRFFNEHLGQAIAQAGRYGHQVAIMFIDLDKFKPVNDTLGHDAGDELLVKTAGRLLERVRKSDTVARLGGDEFAVILPEIKNREEVEFVSIKILEALITPFTVVGNKVEISGTIGVAVYPDDGSSWEEVLKHADTAMYFSKKARRGSYRFYDKDMKQVDS